MPRDLTFSEWLEKKHPEVKLLPWQLAVAHIWDASGRLMFTRPLGAGKTFLLKLYKEYLRGKH